jgi:hypothetical protein
MKYKRIALFLVVTVILFLTSIPYQNVDSATSIAYLTPFVTSITYQNVGSATTNSLAFTFYNSEMASAPFTYNPSQLARFASGSVYLGSFSQTNGGFNGAVKITSDQTILETLVQIPKGKPDIIVRPLSNGFSSGSTNSYIGTVLKYKWGATTVFSVQNVGQSQINISISLYDSSGILRSQWPETIQPGGAYIFDAGSNPNLDDYNFPQFDGSAVITSNGLIAATVMEKEYSGVGAKAFEGFGSGALTMFMPSALCNYAGSSSAFAVQNISQSQSTYVTVTYTDGTNYYYQYATILPNTKASFQTCSAPGIPQSNFSGTAIITSNTTNIIAVGKITGNGLSTAYNGVVSGAGRLSLPYIRWATDNDFNSTTGYQRAFISIQNLSTSTQPAGVTVNYIDKYGTTIATQTLNTIPPSAKANSWFGLINPSSDFGYYPDGSAGGGVYINCTSGPCQLAAIARVQGINQAGGLAGEDYNAMPIP